MLAVLGGCGTYWDTAAALVIRSSSIASKLQFLSVPAQRLQHSCHVTSPVLAISSSSKFTQLLFAQQARVLQTSRILQTHSSLPCILPPVLTPHINPSSGSETQLPFFVAGKQSLVWFWSRSSFSLTCLPTFLFRPSACAPSRSCEPTQPCMTCSSCFRPGAPTWCCSPAPLLGPSSWQPRPLARLPAELIWLLILSPTPSREWQRRCAPPCLILHLRQDSCLSGLRSLVHYCIKKQHLHQCAVS